MGLLDELIILAKEAIDENTQSGKATQRTAPTTSGSGKVTLDELREQMRRAQAPAQPVAKRPAPSPRQTAPTDESRAAERKHARASERAAEHAAEVAAATAKATAAAYRPAERLAHLMRQPRTIRELFLVKELLDRPLCLRRPRS